MAKSGSFNTTAYNGRYLQFTWSTTSVNVASNTTTISWSLKGAGNASVWYKSGNFKVVINGETVYSSSTRIELDNGTNVASGTYTIKHNADGTKSFTASAEAGIYTTAVNCTGSGTFTLDPIARASQPSCVTYPQHTQNVGNFGATIDIFMNRASSSFAHTVRYAFGSRSGTIATGVTNDVQWTIPLSFMDLLPATMTGSGTIYVDTYNGSTLIGTKYCGFTATVPSSVIPKCSIQVLDATTIKDTYGNLVKGLSKLYVKTTGTPSYSSPIKSYNVSANGVRYTAAEITTGVLAKAGTTTVTATVTDQRGRTSESASASFTVLDYAPPTVSKLTATRCNQDGTANRRGAYVKVVFSASVTNLNSKNTAQYKVKYKKTTDSTYTTVTVSAINNTYSVSNRSYIFAASAGSSYDVTVEAVDRHNTSAKSVKAPTASAIFSWRGFRHSSGTQDGAGIGKVPEKPNTLQVGWPAEFEDSLIQIGNKYSFSSPGVASTAGFVRMARITITAANADSPITFVFTQRRAISPMTVHVALTNSTTTASSLNSFTYEGTNYLAYLVKSEAMVWDLYVQKSSEWDTITMQDWGMSATMESRCTVTFPGDLVATVPNGLDGYYRATPVVLRSIIDCVMPVGFVLTLYSHADPNDMYEGTTWVRIQNAFLWATTATGTIGQTGGAQTVTLTGEQIPSHTHGSVYSANATGDKTLPWLSTGVLGTGDKLAYGTVSAGGGQPHNNMPPYVQVSIWRRTE